MWLLGVNHYVTSGLHFPLVDRRNVPLCLSGQCGDEGTEDALAVTWQEFQWQFLKRLFADGEIIYTRNLWSAQCTLSH